jgi:2-(3-amino-3-carboxypropyl)histidine synthase
MSNNNDLQIFTKNEKTKIINIIDIDKYKEFEENKLLNYAIEKLPSNYNFEIYKSLYKIKEISKNLKENKKPLIALQFPDGLMIFSEIISDILSQFGNCDTIIIGDITYGACCITDIDCNILNCDLLIHYAHSCLIPMDKVELNILYIFVEIKIDIDFLVKTIELNFPKELNTFFYIASSIQFNSVLFILKKKLIEKGYLQSNINIPHIKPRCIGEIIGCTSPKLKKKENSIVLFICDGRFHMESLMIQNPDFTFYQYNPFLKKLTIEEYDINLMKKIRFEQINKLKESKLIGILHGTLGKQGDPKILKRLNNLLKEKKINFINIMMNEITEAKIKKFPQCDCFIQTACPRLSIDWSDQFSKPMLTPYETYIAFNKIPFPEIYEMSNYSNETGEWGHFYKK